MKNLIKKLLSKINYNNKVTDIKRVTEDIYNSSRNNLDNICNIVSKINEIDKKIDQLFAINEFYFLELYKKEGESIRETKKRFLNNLPYDNDMVKLFQKGDLILLKNFIDICNKSNLTYWLCAGSAFGAYMYNGFVPWDDDVDVSMFPDDFEKFRKIIKNNKDFELHEFIRSTDYDLVYKLVFRNHGAFYWVDIFVMDKIYVSVDEALAFKKSYREKIVTKIKNDNEICNYFLKFQSVEDSISSEIEHPEYYKYFIYNYDYFNNKNLKKPIGIIANLNLYDLKAYNYEVIFPLKQLKFCGMNVNVPNKIEKYLEMRYGYLYNLPRNYSSIPHYTFCQFPSFNYEEEIEFLNKFEK